MTVQGQAAVNYGYEGAGRLSQITQGGSTVGFTYDAAGRRTSTSSPNGITMAYTYDVADQLTGIDYKQGTTVIGDLTYEYDEAGNRVAIGGSFGRIGLPPALTSAVYDAANRAVQWGGTTLTYDDNGNLTSDGSGSYGWNARDQLTAMSGASFQYDGLARRTGKTVGGWATSYLHDGMNVVAQFGVQAATLLTGLGIDETFIRTDSTGARHFLTDALGSTLALADGAGAVQTEYTYEPFGKNTSAGQPNANPFQFTGRENDGTGLYYYRARYYHPGLQWFVSEDPLEYAGGDVNLQSYVGNNPVSFRDPLGFNAVEDFFMGIIDATTFGITRRLPMTLRGDTDECSFGYWLGDKVPLLIGGARLAYAGLAKGIPIVASPATEKMARAAVNTRNALKTAFRGGLFADYRRYSYEHALAKYGSNEAVIRAAGRTNSRLNVTGGALATGSLVNNPECGCQ